MQSKLVAKKLVLAAAIIAALGWNVAMATPQTIVTLTSLYDGYDFTYDGGIFATTIVDEPAFVHLEAPLAIDTNAFGSFTISGVAATGSATVIAGSVSQNTFGGNFSISLSPNVLILTGNFLAGEITGVSGGTSGGVNWNLTGEVNYTYFNPTYFNPLEIAGSGHLAFSGATPPLVVTAGVLQPFKANGGLTLDASPRRYDQIPEPNSVALLGLGLIGLGGLMRLQSKKGGSIA